MLEQRLKTSLFERLPSGVILTDSGTRFFPYAMQIMSGIKDGIGAIKSEDNSENFGINIAMSLTRVSTPSDLTKKLKIFRQSFPNTKIELRKVKENEIVQRVQCGDIHIGLSYAQNTQKDIESFTVYKDKLVTVCSPDNPLSKQALNNIEQLHNSHFICFSENSHSFTEPYQKLLKKQLAIANIEHANLITVDSLVAQKHFIAANFGIGILPLSSVKEELKQKSLHLIKHPTLERDIDIYLIHKTSIHLNKAIHALIQILFPTKYQQA